MEGVDYRILFKINHSNTGSHNVTGLLVLSKQNLLVWLVQMQYQV